MSRQIQIIVASKNPVKIKCVRDGFEKMFPDVAYEIQGMEVPSGVSVQPATEF